MSDKNIKQVLEIEKQSQEIYEKAKHDAQQLPILAEQEAQALIAKAKAEAEDEARKIIAAAQSESGANISADADAKNNQFDALAKKNFDKAVAYVLDRVIGKA